MSRAGFAVPASAPAVRLTGLHLASRRVPVGVIALAATGITLRVVLSWTPSSGMYSVLFPLIVATGAASVTGVTTRSPFGDPERAAGRYLPWMRLAAVLIMSCLACCALATGTVGAHMALGLTALLRDFLGLTGIALLTAAVTGASLSWIGSISYLVLSIYAVGQHWTTPWIWPDRPAGDPGAAICAAIALAAGIAVIAARGAPDTTRE